MKRVDSNLDLAARLGAEVSRLTAKDLPTEVLRFADQENITQIIMGRSTPGFLKRFLGRSLSDEIMRQAHGVSVHIITDDQVASTPIRLRRPRIELGGVAAAPFAVSAAVLVGLAASHLLKLPNLSMIFLAAVLFCAVTFGTWSAVIAAGLSFPSLQFFLYRTALHLHYRKSPRIAGAFLFSSGSYPDWWPCGSCARTVNRRTSRASSRLKRSLIYPANFPQV